MKQEAIDIDEYPYLSGNYDKSEMFKGAIMPDGLVYQEDLDR